MVNKTLRKLARAHADGSIDKDAYRKARAELIQGILSDQIPLKVIEYPPLVQPPEAESLDDTQQRKHEVKKTAKKRKSSTDAAATSTEVDSADTPAPVELTPSAPTNKLLFIGLAVVVLASIVVAMLAFTGDSSTPAGTSSGAANNKSETASALIASTPAQTLIREFLQKKNWSTASLNDFQQQWSTLATDDVMASLEMGQLKNAIFKQLLEERALSGLVDDDSSLNKQRKLIEFASALGINDERISMPEPMQP